MTPLLRPLVEKSSCVGVVASLSSSWRIYSDTYLGSCQADADRGVSLYKGENRMKEKIRQDGQSLGL